MKRLPMLGLILALAASCSSSLESSEQAVACYDTGSGMKCVQLADLPADATAACIDNDGVTDASASSASGPSAEDNDASASSDSPGLLPPGAEDEGDASSAEDTSGASDSTSESTEDGCAGGADNDGDGVSDAQDCDCLDPDSPTTPPPAGEGGPVII